jgi:WD40 repeat protein/DNA-binding SARP family transcriptional activator
MEGARRPLEPRLVMGAGVDYSVLGRLQAVRDGEPRALGGPRQRMVLAVLLANANRTVSQDDLIDAVWSGAPPDAARSTLHGYISVLRKELGGEILRQGDGYCVRADDHLDASRFERLVAAGRAELDRDPAAALFLLQEALALWYGHPFGDLGGEPALADDVLRLEDLRLTAVEARVEADLALGNHAGVASELETLIRENPYRERLRALQMLALYRCGRQAEALRAYERTRQLLDSELGIDPAPELRRLQMQILNQDPGLDVRIVRGTGDRQPPATRPGTLRGYELRGVLGGGRLSEVHRAYQPSVGREVAVKIISPDLANQTHFIRDFEARAHDVAQLEHPHIVPLIDYWRDPSGAYLVMPLMLGESVEESLLRAPWSATQVLKLVGEVGAALRYAHGRGVIHGQVNASNVLLDEDRNAHLTGFDIGQVVVGPHGVERSNGYAPERAAGRPLTVRTDIFGLGALAARLLRVEGLGRPSTPVSSGDTTADPLQRTTPVDRPCDLVGVLTRATAEAPEDRFDTVAEFLQSMSGALGAENADVMDANGAEGGPAPPRNPYKGLRPFTETDGADFFGRSALIDELTQAVEAHPLVAVVGPSGSGKSSVVRAGLIPRIRSAPPGVGRWLVTDMIPGSFPFEELAASLMRVAVEHPPGLVDRLTSDEDGLLRVVSQFLPADDSRLLLIIDQFEELFTAVVSERTRALFLDSLVRVAQQELSRVTILVTIRADFFDRPLEHPELGRLVSEGLVTVTPPSTEGLVQAVVGPAHLVGLEVEPGLVEEILRDAGGQPGTLPLLQYALTELFDRRDGTMLTVGTYRATGGAVGALSTRAEELFGELAPRMQTVARQVFLRLVSVDALAGDTRRRVRVTDLRSLAVDPDALETVLGRFGEFRLLSFDRDPVTRTPTVEVAHEALLSQWPRLADWIDEERENLVVERGIDVATHEWLDSGNDQSFLLRGGRLDQAERWAARSGIAPSGTEVDFLNASRALRDSEAKAVRGRRRLLVTVLATGLAAALIGGLLAVVQRDQARRSATAARQAETTELAQRLGAQALLEQSLGLSLLLARQAAEIADTPETRGYLFDVLLRQPKALGVMYGPPRSLLKAVAVSPDGRTIALADEEHGSVLFFDAKTLEQSDAPLHVSEPLQRGGEGPTALAFSPDGHWLAIGSRFLQLFDMGTRREVAAKYTSSTAQIVFSEDGSRIATVDSSSAPEATWITTRDAQTLEPTAPVIHPPGLRRSYVAQISAVPPIALTNDGRSVIVPSMDKDEISWWDIATGRQTRTVRLGGAHVGFRPIALSPDDSTLAVGLASGFAMVDIGTGALRHVGGPHAAQPIGLLFSPDGDSVVSTHGDGTVAEWDTRSATLLDTLVGHTRAVWSPAFSPDGRTLYTPSFDGTAIAWDIDGTHGFARRQFRFTDAAGIEHDTPPGRISPDGQLMAVGLASRQGVGLWDAAALKLTRTLNGTRGTVRDLQFSPNARMLVALSEDRQSRRFVTVWDLTSGVRRLGPIEVGDSPILDISPDGSMVATDAVGAGIQIWEIATGRPVARIGTSRSAESAKFIHGGRIMLFVKGASAEIWSIENHSLVSILHMTEYTSPTGFATTVNDEGTLVATGGLDPLIRVWSVETGQLVRLIEHDLGTVVWDLEFTPDGMTLAASGGDGFVSLWDVPTGAQIGPRLTVGGRDAKLDVSPDGGWLLTTLADGQGAIWDIDPQSWLTRSCAVARRQLTPDEWDQYLPSQPFHPACEPKPSA